MLQLRRAAVCLAVACYAALSSFALAATTDGNATAPSLVETTTTNATARMSHELDAKYPYPWECRISFWYWDHAPRFDINYVHSQGVDHTSELFDGGSKPIVSTNYEHVYGILDLVQIWPGDHMVCISHVVLTCGDIATGYGRDMTVRITADAMQQAWINKTEQRKPVDWNQGPCMYYRSASWDSGAFRAMDIYHSAFLCDDGDYYCVASNIEMFGN